MKQAVTRVEDKEYDLFQETAKNIGTTTADALRMFIYAFNDYHGFPYPVQSRRIQVEPFDTEKEATDFATDLAMEMIKWSVEKCLFTSFESDDIGTRVPVEPSTENGLQKKSYVMTDKIITVNKNMLGNRIGVVSDNDLVAISEKLKIILDLWELIKITRDGFASEISDHQQRRLPIVSYLI